MQKSKFIEEFPELTDKLVLNVDDNEMNQLVISQIMKNVGINIICVNNGAEAVEKLEGGLKPDFILMDLQMPVLNGVQTAEIIKKKINKEIPIIINTGYVTPRKDGDLEGWE
jgi:two-component system sensor histidine kinase/response regulator